MSEAAPTPETEVATTIVRIRRNWFDSVTGFDAVTKFDDGTSCQTVARVRQSQADYEFRENKDTEKHPTACPIERASDADLAAYEAMVAAGTAKKKSK